MSKYSKIFLFIVCAFLAQIELFAVEVTDLYSAHVPVTSKADTEKKLALKQAMKAVIIKVAGQPEVLSNKVIKQSLNRYYQFYTQFRYQKINDENVLTVTFNENKINAILAQAELPIWGSLRPKILLWIVDENGLTRQIVPTSLDSYITEDIALFSNNRGLPFVLPEIDETDKAALTISDVWGRFSDATLAASNRYGAESVVILRLSNSSLVSVENADAESTKIENTEASPCIQDCNVSAYALDWRFISNRQRLNETSTYQGSNAKALLNQALEDITEQVYKRYALTSNEQQAYKIDVANINSLVDYINVTSFLSELSSVKAVTLVNVKESNRRFNLQLIGSPEAFLATLKLHKSLEQFVDPLADVDLTAPPVFYWKQY